MNRRIVVYGVLNDERLSARSLKLGVNTILRAPVAWSEALNRVRSTVALLSHELRRYVRIPLVMTISARC